VSTLSEAYTAGAEAWAGGPTRVYGRLAELLVAFSPTPVVGHLVLDLGSGTGVGSRAALECGARVVAVDLAVGMLTVDRAGRPPAIAADASSLPLRDDAVDIVLAPFCLNHLPDPSVGVRESARVGRLLVLSTYAVDDDHPAKQAVDTAMTEAGWVKPDWYVDAKAAMAAWGTVDAATAALERGGMTPIAVERREVTFPELGAEDLVAWRAGMAQSEEFLATLDEVTRAAVLHRAVELVGSDPEPLVRRVIFVAAISGPAR
jgi:SAM-dependent methyltransferase